MWLQVFQAVLGSVKYKKIKSTQINSSVFVELGDILFKSNTKY